MLNNDHKINSVAHKFHGLEIRRRINYRVTKRLQKIIQNFTRRFELDEHDLQRSKSLTVVQVQLHDDSLITQQFFSFATGRYAAARDLFSRRLCSQFPRGETDRLARQILATACEKRAASENPKRVASLPYRGEAP